MGASSQSPSEHNNRERERRAARGRGMSEGRRARGRGCVPASLGWASQGAAFAQDTVRDPRRCPCLSPPTVLQSADRDSARRPRSSPLTATRPADCVPKVPPAAFQSADRALARRPRSGPPTVSLRRRPRSRASLSPRGVACASASEHPTARVCPGLLPGRRSRPVARSRATCGRRRGSCRGSA